MAADAVYQQRPCQTKHHLRLKEIAIDAGNIHGALAATW
jgi:hypothetical protein